MYRPLPDGITVGPSNIEGTGLLTTKPIKADVVLGIVLISNNKFSNGYIRTALGAFYILSDNPNCITKNGYWHQIPVKYLVTLRDIEAGEELTAKYTLYTVDDYPWE